MREILFRGKTTDSGEWVEGYYVHYDDIKDNGKDDCDYIVQKHNGVQFPFVQVIPETVGQHTGLTDKNGTKIFEWDIVKHSIGTFVVKYLDGMFCCSCIEAEYLTNLGSLSNDCVVIGNIHDNPELLKGGAEE